MKKKKNLIIVISFNCGLKYLVILVFLIYNLKWIVDEILYKYGKNNLRFLKHKY